MEREIHIEGKPYRFLSEDGIEGKVISVEGKRYSIRYLPLPDGRRLCLVNGSVVEWNGLPEGISRIVRRGGVLSRLEVIDPRSRRARISEAASKNEKAEIKAPMPGKVVSTLCKKGDDVAANQGIVVLEAMKMENELRSPIEGKVVELNIEPGQAVETGQRIAIIEPIKK